VNFELLWIISVESYLCLFSLLAWLLPCKALLFLRGNGATDVMSNYCCWVLL